MPLALVHGNPETAAVWDDLLPHLAHRDVVRLSPPGFGAPVPVGFAASADEYLDWLVGAVRALDGPVDLVGHDWGGGHVLRLACTHPELVRSWASDIAGCFDPEYVWHEMARTWQTPGEGEKAIARMLAAPRLLRVPYLVSLGMSMAVARGVAAGQDAAMGRCVLALYRSAAQPAMARWGEALPQAAARPGLVIIPTEDRYTGGETLARRSAARAGAQVAVLTGLGHWWMCEDPARGAAAIDGFLSEVERAG